MKQADLYTKFDFLGLFSDLIDAALIGLLVMYAVNSFTTGHPYRAAIDVSVAALLLFGRIRKAGR